MWDWERGKAWDGGIWWVLSHATSGPFVLFYKLSYALQYYYSFTIFFFFFFSIILDCMVDLFYYMYKQQTKIPPLFLPNSHFHPIFILLPKFPVSIQWGFWIVVCRKVRWSDLNTERQRFCVRPLHCRRVV